ncbi:MAG: glycosyl hydrolase family 5 [Lachnospiraceae bacterium]|nr:glycosyl hydrolase family 5 [Lachnospiraceae bacterium]
MKDKRNIVIIILAALVVILLVILAFMFGINIGQNTATNTTQENAVVQEPVETSAPEDTNNDVQTSSPNIENASSDQTNSSKEPTEETISSKEEAAATPIPETIEEGALLPEEAFTLTINTDDTWGDSTKYYRMNMMLTNNMDEAINGWTLRINVGENAAIDSSWRGKYSMEQGTLIVTNEDYNAQIPAGGTIDFGLIITNISGDLSYTVETSGTNSGNHNTQSNGQSADALSVPAPTTDDWLYVKNNKIVDSEGKEVWITGVNWFGYNTGTNIFDGIWNSDLNQSIQSIANHGFNLIRIPISAELLLKWKNGEYPTANYNHATNYYLENLNSLEIFDYVIDQCRANGLKIMIDIHSAKTDASGHLANMWYNGDITTEKYQEALVWIAERYAEDDTIIAYDLKNEPHGKPSETDRAIWNDSKDKSNWKYIAEQTALKILEKNPNVLIMIEGTEIYPVDITKNGDFSSTNDSDYYFNWWGGNLRGVADYPINLGKYQNKLVYSPHDYGPTVYQQPWFHSGYDYNSLYEDCWHDNWLYIYEDGTAPLLIGEWGGFMREPNLTWMTHMRTLIKDYHLHHTFWCFNANSGDTGGLVLDDFTTWDEEKYAFVKEALWQENGKFVGLDHEIPLGTAGNGITLSEATGLQ